MLTSSALLFKEGKIVNCALLILSVLFQTERRSDMAMRKYTCKFAVARLLSLLVVFHMQPWFSDAASVINFRKRTVARSLFCPTGQQYSVVSSLKCSMMCARKQGAIDGNCKAVMLPEDDGERCQCGRAMCLDSAAAGNDTHIAVLVDARCGKIEEGMYVAKIRNLVTTQK